MTDTPINNLVHFIIQLSYKTRDLVEQAQQNYSKSRVLRNMHIPDMHQWCASLAPRHCFAEVGTHFTTLFTHLRAYASH